MSAIRNTLIVFKKSSFHNHSRVAEPTSYGMVVYASTVVHILYTLYTLSIYIYLGYRLYIYIFNIYNNRLSDSRGNSRGVAEGKKIRGVRLQFG